MINWIEEAETALHASTSDIDNHQLDETTVLALIAIAHELKSIGDSLGELKRIDSNLLYLREVLDRD